MTEVSEEIRKLRLLLPHWIEHNREHASEFRDWAAKVGEANSELVSAADFLDAASSALVEALKQLGG